jgi:hypothetical protein
LLIGQGRAVLFIQAGLEDNNNNPGAWQKTRVNLDWISILRRMRALRGIVLLGRTQW